MKRLILCFLMIFVLMSEIANAGLNQGYLLLDAVDATGPGTAYNVSQAYINWVCDVTITGSPTAVTVRVEGNAGNTALYDPGGLAEFVMSAEQLTAGIGSFEIIYHTAKKVRGNLITLTGGTAPTVTLDCVGRD